jgi:putative oxidoreductase
LWWQNRGELVMLYSFVWLLFAAWGAGPYSLDAMLRQRSDKPSRGSPDNLVI